jgi:hypothetical protein
MGDHKGADQEVPVHRSFTVVALIKSAALMKMALRETTDAMINGVFIEHKLTRRTYE